MEAIPQALNMDKINHGDTGTSFYVSGQEFFEMLRLAVPSTRDLIVEKRLNYEPKHETVQLILFSGPVQMTVDNTRDYIATAKRFSGSRYSSLALLGNHVGPSVEGQARTLAVWQSAPGDFGVLTAQTARVANREKYGIMKIDSTIGPDWYVTKVFVADLKEFIDVVEHAAGEALGPAELGAMSVLLAGGFSAADSLARL